jgi:hypothetical protein
MELRSIPISTRKHTTILISTANTLALHVQCLGLAALIVYALYGGQMSTLLPSRKSSGLDWTRDWRPAVRLPLEARPSY